MVQPSCILPKSGEERIPTNKDWKRSRVWNYWNKTCFAFKYKQLLKHTFIILLKNCLNIQAFNWMYITFCNLYTLFSYCKVRKILLQPHFPYLAIWEEGVWIKSRAVKNKLKWKFITLFKNDECNKHIYKHNRINTHKLHERLNLNQSMYHLINGNKHFLEIT